MSEPTYTKAQLKRIGFLERRGYDWGYHSKATNAPVMVLRDKGIWVEIARNGSYGPTTKPTLKS